MRNNERVAQIVTSMRTQLYARGRHSHYTETSRREQLSIEAFVKKSAT